MEAENKLEAAKARVRALERRMGLGTGAIMMMAGKDRAAKYRDRQRRQVMLIEGEVDLFTLVDGLIRRNAISEQGSRDRKLLNAAAIRFLADQLKK